LAKYSVRQHIYGLGNCLAFSPSFSGLQEYALLSANGSFIVTEGFTDDQVATLPINATTSFWALFQSNWPDFPHPAPDRKDKRDLSNEKLVIIDAGSNAGRLVVQFAKLAGIGTIISVTSISREEESKDMSATHVLDRHLGTNTLAAEVATICGGQ
jgi:NADPH2:quinone reductase